MDLARQYSREFLRTFIDVSFFLSSTSPFLLRKSFFQTESFIEDIHSDFRKKIRNRREIPVIGVVKGIGGPSEGSGAEPELRSLVISLFNRLNFVVFLNN